MSVENVNAETQRRMELEMRLQWEREREELEKEAHEEEERLRFNWILYRALHEQDFLNGCRIMGVNPELDIAPDMPLPEWKGNAPKHKSETS